MAHTSCGPSSSSLLIPLPLSGGETEASKVGGGREAKRSSHHAAGSLGTAGDLWLAQQAGLGLLARLGTDPQTGPRQGRLRGTAGPWGSGQACVGM